MIKVFFNSCLFKFFNFVFVLIFEQNPIENHTINIAIHNQKTYLFSITIESKYSSHHFGDYLLDHQHKQTTDWLEVLNPSIYWYTSLGPTFIDVCLFGLDFNDSNIEFHVQDTCNYFINFY